MKLAFLISAHKDAKHLRDLITSLPKGSEFFIHIDAKSNIRNFEEKVYGDNIHFIKHRVNVVWGSINEVEYQMELIRAALYECQADYLITMSGMDYPVWSNRAILDYFYKAKEEEREYYKGYPCYTKENKHRNIAILDFSHQNLGKMEVLKINFV